MEELTGMELLKQSVKVTEVPKGSRGRPKKEKDPEKKLTVEEAFEEAIQALPEKLKDCKFLNQYAKHRLVARAKRESAKAEREKAQRIIDKYRQETDQVNGEIIGSWRTKDYQINLWELANGKYYKEIIARQGLRISD